MQNKSKFHRSGILLAVLAPTLCTGLLHGAGLSLSATTANTITCNTAIAGPGGPVTITVKPGSDITYPVVVTLGTLPAGLAVSPSTVTFLTSGSANVTTGQAFIFSAAQGCAGLVSGANSAATFHFVAAQGAGAATADPNNVSTTITVVSAATGLSATVNSSTVFCSLNAGTYSANPLVLTVNNTEIGGTPFTIAKPSWLTLATNPPYSVTSGTTPSAISFTPACSGPVGTVLSGSIVLGDAPAPSVTIPLTYKVVAPATLTATTPTVQSYVKASGANFYPTWTVNLAGATAGQIFTVNPTTLGAWLTATPLSGAFGTTNSIQFQATGGIDSLSAQNAAYVQTVHIGVQGYADTTVSISLAVTNPAATLSFAEGNVRNLTWVQGQGIPTATITAVSSSSPIQFSTTTSGAIAPIIATTEASGLAYNFGTQIPVTFPNLAFSEAQPGAVLTGVVRFAWGTTSSTVTFYVTVAAGTSTAVLGSAIPSNLPTATAGEQFTVTLYGSGFVPVSDPTQRTNVGIVNGNNQIVQDANIISTQVVNSSTIALTIQAPVLNADPLLPWSGSSVTFGVCNPAGGICSAPTGTLAIQVGAGPTISGVVSASTLTSATPPNVAPYDILTIWGSNFCTSNGTGCGPNGILYGVLNPATNTYTTGLTPDGGQRYLTVSFKLHGALANTAVAAPLLFATNSQINLVVPANNFPAAASAVDVIVTFGGLSSTFTGGVVSVATDPGIFTIDAFGQGAILNPSYTIANGSNPAAAGSVVLMYATGLGTPTSLTGATPVQWNSTTCITPSGYETNAGNGTSVDGVLIQSTLLTGDLPPCFGTGAPSSIKVGGTTAGIGYTGWVADSVAGLYQSNVTLPIASLGGTDAAGTVLAAITSPVQMPVQITSNAVASPAPGTNKGLNPGVTMWVAPAALTMTVGGAQPTRTTGQAWTTTVTASGGTGPYTYKVDGLASPSTGGLTYAVSGSTPWALTFALAPTPTGYFAILVTATDANGVTGSTTLSLNVTGGSAVVLTNSAIMPSAYGTANAAVTTITPTGGVAPYSYAVTTPASGVAVSSTGVVSTTAAAVSGYTQADITVTDSTGTPLVQDFFFDVPVGMSVTATNNVTTLTGVAGLASTQALTTISNLGGGTVTYALVQPDTAKCAMTLVSRVLTVPATCVAGTYSVSVVGTDSAPPAGGTSAVSVLNLSVHLN